MAAPASVTAVTGAIQAVRQMLAKNGRSVEDLCTAINKCATNKAHRYVLYSVDSVFEGVELPSTASGEEEKNVPKSLTRTLFKLPKAVYMPRSSEVSVTVTKHGPTNLGHIVDDHLEKWVEANSSIPEYAAVVQELTNTVEYMAENALDAFYGPLRPSALGMLNSYKEVLLNDKRLGDLKKLSFATQLLNLLKVHSVDTDDLRSMIIDIITKTPSIIRQCKLGTLETLSKMKLPGDCKDILDDHLQMNSTRPLGIGEWSEFLWLVARNSDKRNTIDCYLHSYKIVMRNAQRDGKDKEIPNSALMNVVYVVGTLERRLKPNDPVFKNSLRVLEAIWPYIEEQIATFEPAELIEIAACYFEHHRVINPLMKNGNRNCVDFLMREISRRSDEFLLKDWVSLVEAMDSIRDVMAVNVLMDGEPTNYYVKVEVIQQAWLRNLVALLKQNELTDLADSIYSLSLPQCSNLCKHLVVAGLYEEPLSAIIERRCLSLIADVKYHTSRHVYDHYFVQFQMVLPLQNGLRMALESNKKLSEFLSKMSGNNLLRLLGLAKYCSPADCKLLFQKLAAKIESCVIVLTSQQYMRVLKYASHFRDSNLMNAVIAAVTPKLLSSTEAHKGFSTLLDLSKFVLSMPKEECFEQTASSILNELIVQHAPVHVRHLSLQHLYLLLLNIQRSGSFPKSLIGDILSHAMEVDLGATTPSQVTNVLCTLADIGIRHEYLVDRLEDWLIMSVTDLENEDAAKVLTGMASSMARIGMKRARLKDLLERVITGNKVPITRWDYDALELGTKVDLLHAVGLFGSVNEEFEKVFMALVSECEQTVKNSGNAISFTKLDPVAYRKLYDTYITLLMNGLAGSSEGSEVTKSDFLLDHLPCYHWFKHQEQLCAEFKDSPHYVQLKNALKQIGIEGAESRVTEAYFAHMVLDSPEIVDKLKMNNSVIYLVPTKDELKWWTSKGDADDDITINKIESYKCTIGDSARVIDHLQKSGWNVITIFTPEWDAMGAGEREGYLKDALKLNKEQQVQ